MILEFHLRLSIVAKDSARALDILPDHSKKDDICQTNIHAHCHESLAANLSFLQKLSHNLPDVIQREEMLLQMSHGQQPSQPDLAIKDPKLQILEIPSQGQQHLIQLQRW